MKVFISWSGKTSNKVAIALRDWLPMILQYVEPWLSSTDIPTGSRWAAEIEKALAKVDYGIICLTKENLNSTWLNFEAGAISKRADSKIIIFSLDVDFSEISGPLSQFQAIKAEKNDLKKLIHDLNSVTEKPIAEKIIDNLFENLLPGFESTLNKILNEETKPDNFESVSLSTIDNKLDKIIDKISECVESDSIQKNEIIEKSKSRSTGKPKVFLGSSTEGLEIAYAIQENLDYDAEVTIWNQNVFNLSDTTIESIVDTAYNFDFAVMVFTPDDVLIKRNVEYISARDNVIFELGLFTGILGRGRTFLVYDRDSKIHIPSDISGVTAATFSKRRDGNLLAALMPVCQRLKRAIGIYIEE